MVLQREKTDPFLPCPALCHCCLWNHDQLENSLVSLPQMAPHLEIAGDHPEHGDEVGEEEEEEVVHVVKRRHPLVPIWPYQDAGSLF